MLDLVKGSLYLHLLLQTSLILLVDFTIFFLFQLYIRFILLNLLLQLFQVIFLDLLWFDKLFEPEVVLDLVVELLTLLLELLFAYLWLLLQTLEIFFSLVPSAVGVSSKFDSFLYVFFLVLELVFELGINVFHGIFFLPQLVDSFPQFIVVRGHFVEFLVGPQKFVLKVFNLLKSSPESFDIWDH